MDYKVQFALLFLFVAFSYTHAKTRCPANGERWDSDIKDGEERCILRCDEGKVPTGCHVIRPNARGRFIKPIPRCEKAPLITGQTLAAVGVGVAAVATAPLALAAAGFTGAGVAVGSVAAWMQGPATAAGGLFAASQSAGVVGTAAVTKLAIGGTTSVMSNYVMNKFKGCEQE